MSHETKLRTKPAALAWRATFDFGFLLGSGSIVMEGDSQQVVRIIRGEIACPTNVEDTIRRSTNMVRGCEVVFARRSANGIADAFGKSWFARSQCKNLES